MISSSSIFQRHFSKKYMELPKRDISVLDFSSTKRTWIQVPKHSSQRVSSGAYTDFEWKDYCPVVFRNLQELDNISYADYMVSICGHDTLRELSLLAKTGCLVLPNDQRFVIKIIRKSELKALLEMLPNYYDHVLTYANTLLSKFYGIHFVRPAGGYKVYFVVVGNILQSDLYIHRRFDLKGSSQGRSVGRVAVDETTTFKDLDLELYFLLDPLTRHRILTQVKNDCEFLEAAGIMDYSLLLGLHIEASSQESADGGRHHSRRFTLPLDTSWDEGGPESRIDDSGPYYEPDVKLGREIPARAVQIPKNETGGIISRPKGSGGAQSYNVKLFIGIIDILQGYGVRKRIEHMYKSIHFDSRFISAVNPKVYSTRFQDFLSKIFQPDDQII